MEHGRTANIPKFRVSKVTAAWTRFTFSHGATFLGESLAHFAAQGKPWRVLLGGNVGAGVVCLSLDDVSCRTDCPAYFVGCTRRWSRDALDAPVRQAVTQKVFGSRVATGRGLLCRDAMHLQCGAVVELHLDL